MKPSIGEKVSNRSLPTDCQRNEKIYSTVLLKAASHHIPTGHHILHEEPVPTEILDVMNRRDDLCKRDPTSPELPRLNKYIYMDVIINHPYTEVWQGHLPMNLLPANLVTLPSRKSPGISTLTHNQHISPPCSRPTRFHT